MWNKLLLTNENLAMLLIRIPLGLDTFVHGYQKITNIPGIMCYFDGLGVSHLLAWLAIIAEFFGGIGLMIGLFSRIAAFGVTITMVVAIFERHLRYGYLVNWHDGLPFGTEGYDFHTLAIGMGLAVMLAGARSYSLDIVAARLL